MIRGKLVAAWIERTGQVISQIDSLLDASAINILQDRFQGPTIPMNVGYDRKRDVRDFYFTHGSTFPPSHWKVYSGSCHSSLSSPK